MAVTHLSISCAKSKNVSKQQQHHTERFDNSRQHRNKMIDPEKSKDNINLRPDLQGSYQERFDNIVNSDRYKGRRKKDGTPVIAENGKNAAVKMVQVTVNIGRADENGKRLDDLSNDEITELLKNDVYPMLKDWFGGDANVIGAAIHLDESKPHLHLDIVPLTKDGKLSAKKMLGNENNMRFHQKEWLESMQARRPDLNFQRKQNQKSNGVEMEKLKELTAIAEEKGEDKALNLVSYMRGLDKKRTDAEWEKINADKKVLEDVGAELQENVNEVNAFAEQLNGVESELNQREMTLNGRERVLKGRESRLNERERHIEEQVNNAFRERETALKGRENTLNEREKGLDDEVETRVAKIKHAVAGAFKQLPKLKNTLVAYLTKAREKDEEERKAREQQAQRLAEIADVKTEQLAEAIEQEDNERIEQHTEHLEQINEVSTEIDESQFDMSAETLEVKIDDFDFDESQFDLPTNNQRTL